MLGMNATLEFTGLLLQDSELLRKRLQGCLMSSGSTVALAGGSRPEATGLKRSRFASHCPVIGLRHRHRRCGGTA